jgi:serine protease inhibitor
MKIIFKHMFFIFVILLTGSMLTGFSSCDKEKSLPDIDPKPIVLSTEQQTLINNGRGFSFDLFREVSDEAGDEENVFISPLSVSLALAMTYNGAEGSTQQAMHEAMRLPDIPVTRINEAWQKLIKDLGSVDPKVIMTIANSIWYREGFQVQTPFINANKKYYNAEVRALNFDRADAADIINKWVSDNTNKLIEKIIDNIQSETVMYLINAIYFKGQWKYEFDPAETAPAPFYLHRGGNKEVPMMHQSEMFGYYNNNMFSAAELPYGRGNYSMIVVLPHLQSSVFEVQQVLDEALWHELSDSFSNTRELIVTFPKFSFAFEQKLKKVLSGMGMGIAFEPNMANFAGINPQAELFISEVIHKAFVEVNEEGTEAAAVTAVEVGVTSFDPNTPVLFRVDRPFLFFIKEKYTNAVIFAGRVMDPSES